MAEAGEEVWKRTAALLNEKAAALKPHGISLGYHNHNLEFAPVGKTTGWEILARETDSKLVTFEIDVGWVAAAGLDPVTFLAQQNGRVRQLHVKDVRPSTKTNYALTMDPTEVGSGKLDWARILPTAYKAGCRNSMSNRKRRSRCHASMRRRNLSRSSRHCGPELYPQAGLRTPRPHRSRWISQEA